MGNAPIILMGVSGSGKSTIGQRLADTLRRPFLEGDDFHSASNVKKMAQGTPLQNADRKGWIEALCNAANHQPNAVIGCSALNETVRDWLSRGLVRPPVYVWLTAPEAVLAKRLAARTEHFFDPSLLRSQFEALQAPETAIRVSVDQPIEAVLSEIRSALDDQ